MNVFLWYRWRGALPPDPSSVVWHTVRLSSLHCRYLAATNLPPLPNVWLVNHSGGCSLFGLLKLQTVHARPTSPGHTSTPPPPFTVTPKLCSWVLFPFQCVCCMRHVVVHARMHEWDGEKNYNSGRQDDKDVRCLCASYSFCTESDANFTRLAVF